MTQAFKKLVTDASELEGLPPTALGLAAQQAREEGHEHATAETGPWLLTLDFPLYQPVVTHAKNRCALATTATTLALPERLPSAGRGSPDVWLKCSGVRT